MLSSMIQFVPGGRLRMSSLQLTLRRQCDQIDQSQLVEWSPVVQDDLSWWRNRDRLVLGVSLEQVFPQLELWSDASDVGSGCSLGRAVRFSPVGSGRRRALDQCPGALGDRECSQVVCSTSRRFLSSGLRRQIDSRVVSAEPRRDSFFFSDLHRSEDSPLGGGSVSGDFPTVYYGERQCASGHPFSPKLDLGLRVDAEAGGLQGFVQEVAGVNRPVCKVSNHRCSLYFSPYHNHNDMGTDALLRNWNGWQAYAFPPWSLIPAGLKKLRSSAGVLLTIVALYWPQRPWFPDLLDLVVDGPVALPQSRHLLRQPHFHRFHLGVSRLCLPVW